MTLSKSKGTWGFYCGCYWNFSVINYSLSFILSAILKKINWFAFVPNPNIIWYDRFS